MWKSGSGGSGILIARKSDGRWSPPSGLLLHTAALGFVIGVDVYDCVLVINSMSDLETFTRSSTTLGADVELAVGPVMSAGHLENEAEHRSLERSVLTYVKARGEHRAVNIDGSLVTERVSDNHRFYGRTVSVIDILAGQVPHNDSADLRTLFEVIKSAEGRVDFDALMLQKLALQPAPGDALIENPAQALSPLSPSTPFFGVPDIEDPDPFGVKALEMAGLEIKEAGSRLRPSSSQFEYNPSPTSPLFGHFNHRQSSDTFITQSNRASYMSSRSNKTNFSRMTDAFTQTTVDTRGTTPTSDDGCDRASVDRLPVVLEPVEVDYTQVDDSAIKSWSQEEYSVPQPSNLDDGVRRVAPDAAAEAPVISNHATAEAVGESLAGQPVDERDEDADDEDDYSEGEIDDETLDGVEDEVEDLEDEDEPVVFEVYEAKAIQPARTVAVSQVTQITHAKGSLVNIPKRIAPAVPARSPARASKTDFGEIPAKSPLRNSFQSTKSQKSSSSVEVANMGGVMNSEKTEVAAHVTPASPAEEEVETPEIAQCPSGDGQQDDFTFHTIVENRLSIDDIPKTPSTLQTSGHTSSGDEHEPRTPKAEEEMITAEDDTISQKVSSFEQARRGLFVEAN